MRPTFCLSLLALFAMPCVTGSRFVVATPVTVVNAGFEDISGESIVNQFTFGALNGWDLYDPNGITSQGNGPTFFVGTLAPVEPDPIGMPGVYSFFTEGAPEGDRVGIAFNFFGSGGEGEYGLAQTLIETLQPYTTYTLQVDIGNIASGTSSGGQFFNLDGFSGYRVDLLGGNEVIAQDNNSLFGSIAEGEFVLSTFTFSTGADHPRLGEPLGIRLVNINEVDPTAPNADLEVDFDNVRLSTAPAVVGDYNFNGTVDAADYTIWRDTLNQTGDGLAADGNNDGTVNQADHTFWANRFGNTASGETETTSVPEPSSALLLFAAMGMLVVRRRAAVAHHFRKGTLVSGFQSILSVHPSVA